MTDDVVPFPGARLANDEDADWIERTIWACNCGCTVMYLHADGRVECAACETFYAAEVAESGKWLQRVTHVPADPPPETGFDNFKVRRLHGPAEFFQGHLRESYDKLSNCIAAAILWRDGTTSTYRSEFCQAPDQRRWLLRMLRRTFLHLTRD